MTPTTDPVGVLSPALEPGFGRVLFCPFVQLREKHPASSGRRFSPRDENVALDAFVYLAVFPIFGGQAGSTDHFFVGAILPAPDVAVIDRQPEDACRTIAEDDL